MIPDERPSGSRELTPSGWHDDAYRRDAGHDEMQARCWRLVQEDQTPIQHGRVQYAYYGAFVEYPFTDRGRLIGFADVAVVYQSEETKSTSYGTFYKRYYRFYEIKPRIHSVGAVIRQCKATRILASRSGFENFTVAAVIRSGDPKKELLCEMADFLVLCEPDEAKP